MYQKTLFTKNIPLSGIFDKKSNVITTSDILKLAIDIPVLIIGINP